MNILMKTFFVGLVLAFGSTVSADIDIIGDRTTTKTPADFVGPNSALGNGDFEANGIDPLTFAAVNNWHNLNGDETVNFQVTDGTGGSPQSGSRGAQLSGTTFLGNDKGYTIASAGQIFSYRSYLGQFGAAGNYGLDTTVTAHLFTSTTGVTGTTTVGDTTDLGSVVFNPFNPAAATFNMVEGLGFYTTVAADVGKTVYLGINLFDQGNDAFPRLDVVSLSVTDPTAIPEPTSAGLLGLLSLGLLRRKRV